MQLAENLYFYPWTQTQVNNCNSVFIAGQTPTLVDPGHSQLYGNVETGLTGDGFRDTPPLVIMTHCHPDHLEAAEKLQRAGAKLAMHQAEIDYMHGEGRALASALGMNFPDITFDLILDEGELSLGEHTLEVIHTPGHSPGHVCLHWPRQKALIAGDLVFAQGVGRVDFPGGNGELLKDSIKKVSALDLELVLPGHGPILKGAEQVKKNFALIEQYYFPML
ncbi:MAG: MBL fold metallo-hydrolase [Desulfarculaceae bacterium]|nr:MBL fold metallo-hydrolase [Desulfarculaceae bacterium]MCF8073120.1 MBL fold metallo-hydrolase [Desulfarculaceae bacterium]MCF8101795.1 MBL fold metallo-hydrolase [Desulfarculaceae bacterium]MCF8117359.1 MBL fold metallo-hydrolase [Desulfarculaceae bacterium]